MFNKIKSKIRKFCVEHVKLLYCMMLKRHRKSLVNSGGVGVFQFPLMKNGFTAFSIEQYILVKNKKYFTQVYRSPAPSFLDLQLSSKLMAEILAGNIVERTVNLSIDKKALVPVAFPSKQAGDVLSEFSIAIDSDKFVAHKILANRFHYFPFDAGSNVTIRSDKSFILGDSLQLDQQSGESKKKLVMTIFVDGLGSEVFNFISMQEVMPNISTFFGSGVIFDNCHANSEWTMPSVATLSTGCLASKHKLVDPNRYVHIPDDLKMIGEYFQDDGYLTALISGNKRQSPVYNYIRGFDRTIYKANMSDESIISNAKEHLDVFSGRNNYLWLSFFDLHHFLDSVPSLESQASSFIDRYSYVAGRAKSIDRVYDEKQVHWYIARLRRLDSNLKNLFDYITHNYKDEDIVISLVSDHGQQFLGKQKKILSKQQLRVPMMFRGANKSDGVQHQFVENVDYLPSILSLANIDFEALTMSERSRSCFLAEHNKGFCFSESIFPGKRYEAVIYDGEYILYCNSFDEILDSSCLKKTKLMYELFDHGNGNRMNLHEHRSVDAYVEFHRKHIDEIV